MPRNQFFVCGALIFALFLGACTAEKPPLETEERNMPSPDIPATEAANTDVTFPFSTEHDGIIYDFVLHDTLYTLRSNGAAIGEDAAEASVYFEGWEPGARHPLTFSMHEGLFYAAAIDKINDGLCLEVFDETGKLLRASKPFPPGVTIASEMVFCDGIMYIRAGSIRRGTQISMALYAYDTANETLTKIQDQVLALAAYGEGLFAFATNEGFVVCGGATQTAYPMQLPFQVKSFGYLASEDSVYALTLSNESVYSLTRINLADGTYEHLRPLQGVNEPPYAIARVLATDARIYMKYTQDDYTVMENRSGDWGKKADALEVLSLSASTGTPLSLSVFNSIYGNAMAYLHDEMGYQYVDVHVTHQTLSMPEGDAGTTQVDLNALLKDGSYDLVLFDDNLTMALTDDSALADLSAIPALDDMFIGMLAGVKDLCTVNGKLLGAPNLMSANGLLVSLMNLIAGGGQMPQSGWTIADYQTMAASAKNKAADAAALLHRGDMHPLWNAIGCNILAGNIPAEAEYAQLLDVYSVLLADGLLRGSSDEGNTMPDYAKDALIGHAIAAAAYDDMSTVHFPLYSDSAKIPVRLDVLALTEQAKDKPEAIDFLQAYMHRDVLQKVYGATFDGFALDNVYYAPIWYEDAALWADYPALNDYAYVLQNSVHQYVFNWAMDIRAAVEYYADGHFTKEYTWKQINQWPANAAFIEHFNAHRQ